MAVSSIVRKPLAEQLHDVVFDEQGTAPYSHNLEYGSIQFEVVLDNSDEAISDDGNVSLYPDGIFGLTPKALDAEVLLNPLKEDFLLPSVAIKQSNILCGKKEVVGIVHQSPSEVRGKVYNPTEVGRIVVVVSPCSETNGLVEQHVAVSIDRQTTIGQPRILDAPSP